MAMQWGRDRPGERGLTFGQVAEDYERYRPGYPEQVVDEVLSYAAGPVRTAVEVGAGTGKATRLFARRDITVTAVEPDAQMLGVLRRETARLPVHAVPGTFESFATAERFDLLYSAAAWHWTDPETRWQRAAELVHPGGTLAFFGSPTDLADPALREAVAEARRTIVADDDVHPPGDRESRGDLRWPGTELEESPLFAEVRQLGIERQERVSRHDYLHRLATVSAYLVLPPDDRAEVLSRIGVVLPDPVLVDVTVTVHLARRR